MNELSNSQRVNVHDVATYILKVMGETPVWKLQKLIYYSRVWSIVWDNEILFPEKIEAWANGPVIPALYKKHKGEFSVFDWPWGNINNLTDAQRESIDSVIKFYGGKTSYWLSELTCLEKPWQIARNGLSPTERGDKEITNEMLLAHYSALEVA